MLTPQFHRFVSIAVYLDIAIVYLFSDCGLIECMTCIVAGPARAGGRGGRGAPEPGGAAAARGRERRGPRTAGGAGARCAAAVHPQGGGSRRPGTGDGLGQ